MEKVKTNEPKKELIIMPKTESIQCTHYAWRLYCRDGVFYACGRKHGHGKNSLGTRDRDQAIAALVALDKITSQRVKEKIESGCLSVSSDPLNPVEHSPVSIHNGWEKYLAAKSGPVHLGGLAVGSKKKYGRYQQSFSCFCEKQGVEHWGQVNKRVLQSYGAAIDQALAPRTVHCDLTMQISVSNWLIFENLIPDHCKIKWKLKKPSGSDRYCYADAEVARMLALTLEDSRLHGQHALIMLLSHSGVRIGEAQNLKWPDIDFESGHIKIRDERFDARSTRSKKTRRQLKDGESRTIPCHPELMKYLRQNQKKSGYVVTSPTGMRLHVDNARQTFIKKVIEPLSAEFPSEDDEVGFKDGRFHTFRHFFVSQCFAAGIPETDIRDWVGHSDSKIVELYRHKRAGTAAANMKLAVFGSA